MPAYFEEVDNVFRDNHVDEDLQLTLITPRLTREARNLVSIRIFTNYAEARDGILLMYKLAPGKYREKFMEAERKQDQTFA